MFDACVIAGLAILYGTLHRGFELALKAPAAVGGLLAVAVGAALSLSLHAGPDSRVRQRLNEGPLHELVVDASAMALWVSARAFGFAMLGVVTLTAVLATMDLAGAAGFLALATTGAAATAALTLTRREAAPRTQPTTARAKGPWLTARTPLAIVALVAVRGGRVPPWLVACAGRPGRR